MPNNDNDDDELLKRVRADFEDTPQSEIEKILDRHLDNISLTFGDKRLIEYLKAKYSLESVQAPRPIFGRKAS